MGNAQQAAALPPHPEADALRAAHLLRNNTRVRLFELHADDSHLKAADCASTTRACSVATCGRLTRRSDRLCAFHAETARAHAEASRYVVLRRCFLSPSLPLSLYRISECMVVLSP